MRLRFLTAGPLATVALLALVASSFLARGAAASDRDDAEAIQDRRLAELAAR